MSSRLPLSLLAALLLTAAGPAATAAVCEAKSGSNTTALLELYTSEGCDSCPPADRWLIDLTNKGYRRDKVVPLAFHVDYWNYLGWPDPFAQARFTERQREFARRTNAATVYTPEFVLQGEEYRRWFKVDFGYQLARHNKLPAQADITLRLSRTGQTLSIDAAARTREANGAALYLALYENNLSTQVKAGENRGRTLPHGFVVRELIGPLAMSNTEKRTTVALASDWKLPDLGVAAFVQDASGTKILQALSLDLCPTLQK